MIYILEVAFNASINYVDLGVLDNCFREIESNPWKGDMRVIKGLLKKDYLLQGVLLLSALFLTANFYLISQGMQGICSSKGCEIAGQLLKFPEHNLIIAGAAFFWILWLLVFFACRYNKAMLWKIVTVILFGALAFDGVLLGYQFIEVEVICWLCIGVGGALLAVLLSFAWIRRSIFVIFLGVSIWCGGFMGQAVLFTNVQTPSLSQTDFLTRPAKDKESAKDFYLFFSLNCPHCSQVMANIVLNKAWDVNWHLCSVDKKSEELNILANILQTEGSREMPFVHILQSKQRENFQNVPVPSKLKQQVENAWTFFNSSNYKAVPLLVVREEVGRDIYLTGAQSIAKYLYEKDLIKKWYTVKRLKKKE